MYMPGYKGGGVKSLGGSAHPQATPQRSELTCFTQVPFSLYFRPNITLFIYGLYFHLM